MKRWRETAEIFERILHVERAALATVVRIDGSAYRRPGAKFLVEPTGQTQGGVSGGCLEADVRENALGLLENGGSRLLHYDTGSDDETVWGLGLGCEGKVDIFVQAIASDFPAREALAKMNAHGGFDTAQPFSITTVIEGPQAGKATVGPPADVSHVEGNVFVDALHPPPVLCIFGAGDDARPLASLALENGFDVTVIDHRRGYLTPERFGPPVRLVQRRSSEGVPPLGKHHYAVVQTHSLQHDREWLRALLPMPLAYLGLLGPRGRREEILKQLGTSADHLYAPVGLDLGAEGPEQVAVSIVSEMLAVRAGRPPLHLRDRKGGIHADD
jgi:xanthine/CO dehydrogenase XdhC/CoxF family maturation factor